MYENPNILLSPRRRPRHRSAPPAAGPARACPRRRRDRDDGGPARPQPSTKAPAAQARGRRPAGRRPAEGAGPQACRARPPGPQGRQGP